MFLAAPVCVGPPPRSKLPCRRHYRAWASPHSDTAWLRHALLEAAVRRRSEFRPPHADAFGRRYGLDIHMTTAAGAAVIRSAWIVRAGEDMVRFITCFVL